MDVMTLTVDQRENMRVCFLFRSQGRSITMCRAFVTDSWLESTVALRDASGIVRGAAHSLLSGQRQPAVGGLLEQGPRG